MKKYLPVELFPKINVFQTEVRDKDPEGIDPAIRG
jgi:hypothetical protein